MQTEEALIRALIDFAEKEIDRLLNYLVNLGYTKKNYLEEVDSLDIVKIKNDLVAYEIYNKMNMYNEQLATYNNQLKRLVK